MLEMGLKISIVDKWQRGKEELRNPGDGYILGSDINWLGDCRQNISPHGYSLPD